MSSKTGSGPRVAVIGLRGFPGVMGGVETHCEQLLPRLAEQGWRITVLGRRGYVEEAAVHGGVDIVGLPAPRTAGWEAGVHTLVSLLWCWRRRYRCVHFHGVGPAALVPLARGLGMSVIMTSHGPDYARSRWGGVAKRVLRLGEWLGVRCSNRVIVVAPWIRDGLAQRLGDELVRAKVRVIPNGMPASDDRHDAGVPRRYGLTERGFILAAGRFVPEKGFAELSAAYLQTSQRVPLVIAGAADHKSRFVTRLTEVLDTEPNIRLLGRVPRPDLFSLLSSCSCFMLPSTHEGHPLTLLEAIKADAAIRASDIPAHRDIGLREELYFPTGSVEAMTRAMENVMDGADYRLSALERKTTIRQYSWTEIAVKTDRVYREVFGDSGGIDSGSGT